VSRASYRANTPCRRASQSENSDRIHDFGCCGSAPRDAWLKIPEGVVENGLFYVERVGRAQADGSEIGYGVLIYFFHRSPSFSFSFIHHCFGVFLYDSYDSKLSHPPSLYIYLTFQRWNQFSGRIPCSRARFTA
jgi:hypothetical protein